MTQHRTPWLRLETIDELGQREVHLHVKLVEDGIEFDRRIEMQADHYNGPVSLAVDPTRFRDALRAFGKAHRLVELHLSGPLAPVVLRSLNTGKVPIFTVVTMPIRT